ncbi:MAG: transglycosylase domain-containing protein [Leptothrix sp. (in: b-proteobacteria)]
MFDSLARQYRSRRLLRVGLPVATLSLAVFVLVYEAQSSRLQAAALGKLASELSFGVEPGPSTSIRFPGAGPYDERLGYNQLPLMVDRLRSQGFRVTDQARMSPQLVSISDQGLFPIYREKPQAGLEMLDCRGDALFAARYPERIYERFGSVPRLLVDALLFIENRELLDEDHPSRNPALEWDRLGKAVLERAGHLVGVGGRSAGGSTLATQIEKYRHSPEGRTDSVSEKLRQMASASLRAYTDGADTLPRRQQIVLDYLNTVPLAARAGFGEVHGIGDGLWAWFGRDFNEVNDLLRQPIGAGTPPASNGKQPSLAFRNALIVPQATAFKQALALMVAQRRPSYYLRNGVNDLAELTNSHLRIMASAGVIPPELRDAALAVPLTMARQLPDEEPVSFTDRKAASTLRVKLASLLDVPRNYDLDRYDLSASTSLDAKVQRTTTLLLRSLKDPAVAKAAGLYGEHLLREDNDPSQLMVSFTLFERGEDSNLLRVQTDNLDQPLDLNEGTKLDLGSTAKLRTLITYLELITELHQRWSGLSHKELAALPLSSKDGLGLWARSHLLASQDRSLPAMLDAAMERKYSASPHEVFYTGGGQHTFENFDKLDNPRIVTVQEALRKSINLPFIRLMRDMVQHIEHQDPEMSAALDMDRDHPHRQKYLKRFADQEGRTFLASFYRKYRNKTPEQIEAQLLDAENGSSNPKRLASLWLSLHPQAGADEFLQMLQSRKAGTKWTEKSLRTLHAQLDPARMTLIDRAFTAHMHPLELWLIEYLRHAPQAGWSEVASASTDERQQAYAWLFKTGHRGAQDVRIRNLVEQDAFKEIHHRWQHLGYAFDNLTSSYATALGASGDRPAALAELMGILVNDGMRLPVTRIDALQFARNTPFETRLAYQPEGKERVLAPEIAKRVRSAIIDVVENGTARRLKGTLTRHDGSVVPIGGKTGTGDHRYEVYGRGGQLISARVVSRSGTFVFMIGDRYFGTMMVYAQEPYAEKFQFTSALPTQLLKALTPVLLPMLENKACAPAEAKVRQLITSTAKAEQQQP